jgi:hypothetical protein
VRALAPSLGLHVPSSVPVEVLARLIAEKRQGAVRDSSQAAEIVYEAGRTFVKNTATQARAQAAAMKAEWPDIEAKLRSWACLASTRANYVCVNLTAPPSPEAPGSAPAAGGWSLGGWFSGS